MENEKEIPSVEVPMIERNNPALYRTRVPVDMSYWELLLIESALSDNIKEWNGRIATLPADRMHDIRISFAESVLFREALLARVLELKNDYISKTEDTTLPF